MTENDSDDHWHAGTATGSRWRGRRLVVSDSDSLKSPESVSAVRFGVAASVCPLEAFQHGAARPVVAWKRFR